MTLRLFRAAVDAWEDIDGYAVSRNMPPIGDLPLDRAEHFIWYWLTRNADRQEREKLRTTLWRPPASELRDPNRTAIDPRSPWSAENEKAAFSSLKAALSGRPTANTNQPTT